MTDIAIENGPVEMVFFPIRIVIFHSYVSLPEGVMICEDGISLHITTGYH